MYTSKVGNNPTKMCAANAKDAHRLLIEKYGGDQPLLVLDLANWETPFRQVS